MIDRLARRILAAPRRLPEEAGMAPALDALGGEVVRLRARDGVRLAGRWLVGVPGASPAGPAPGAAAEAGAEPWVVDPRDAVLLLHGYSGSVTPDLLEYAPFLRRTAGVLGLDFRGHGDSDDGPTTFGLLEVEDVAGALAWLGERGIARVVLMGSSMGGITAIAAVAVLGDGRLQAADADPDAPAASVLPPSPRIAGVVADAVSPELAIVVGRRMGRPLGRALAGRAFGGMAGLVGADPRETEPIRVVPLLEDVPLLLVHGAADRLVPLKDARRLVAAAPAGTRHLVVPAAGHGEAHRVDPARYEAEVTSFIRAALRLARS